MITRVRILVHRRKGISTQSAAWTRESGIVRRRRPGVCISRSRVEVVLVRRPQRPVPVLLELDEGALRHRRRIVRLMRRRGSDVRLPRHRRGPGRVLVRAPERGTQIGKIQRREGFVVHFDEVRRRLEWIPGPALGYIVIRIYLGRFPFLKNIGANYGCSCYRGDYLFISNHRLFKSLNSRT